MTVPPSQNDKRFALCATWSERNVPPRVPGLQWDTAWCPAGYWPPWPVSYLLATSDAGPSTCRALPSAPSETRTPLSVRLLWRDQEMPQAEPPEGHGRGRLQRGWSEKVFGMRLPAKTECGPGRSSAGASGSSCRTKSRRRAAGSRARSPAAGRLTWALAAGTDPGQVRTSSSTAVEAGGGG